MRVNMKKLLVFLILTFFSVISFASPFGLKMGMSLKAVEKECTAKPVLIKDNQYLIKPKKSHPRFELYVVLIDDSKGLYEIRAISSGVKTNSYGTEIRSLFDEVKDRISKTYGTPLVRNEIDPQSVFDDEQYWLFTLKNGARILGAIWGLNENLKDHIDTITLECRASEKQSDPWLILYYYFENAKKIENEQDSVF